MRLFFLLSLLAVTAAASPQKFSSGSTRTHLIELFSSEGCSSCPPAEQWLAGLREAPGLWRDFVPVAFHVNYWDRLGWPDSFAKKEFTSRQYAYADRWGSGTVYTPEFALDGSEWRATSGRNLPAASPERTAVLSVEYTAEGGCRVRFDQAGDFEVYVALLGGGIVSEVRAGENNGRKLRHDFVVLVLKNGPLVAGAAELSMPKVMTPGIGRQGLAVWVTRRGQLNPLQATGSWLE